MILRAVSRKKPRVGKEETSQVDQEGGGGEYKKKDERKKESRSSQVTIPSHDSID